MENLGNNSPKKGASRVKKGTVNAALTALMTALIAVCAWISIPLGEISFTMQTFGVCVATCLLGRRRGAAAVLVYILLGAVGVPVFSGFRGGAAVIFGATGGYLVGFILMAYMGGLIIDKTGKRLYGMCIGLGLGLLVMYAFGTAWYLWAFLGNTGKAGLWTALMTCVFPFIIPDIIKIALAIGLSRAVASRIKIEE